MKIIAHISVNMKINVDPFCEEFNRQVAADLYHGLSSTAMLQCSNFFFFSHTKLFHIYGKLNKQIKEISTQ